MLHYSPNCFSLVFCICGYRLLSRPYPIIDISATTGRSWNRFERNYFLGISVLFWSSTSFIIAVWVIVLFITKGTKVLKDETLFFKNVFKLLMQWTILKGSIINFSQIRNSYRKMSLYTYYLLHRTDRTGIGLFLV